jgi:hypothetical protein
MLAPTGVERLRMVSTKQKEGRGVNITPFGLPNWWQASGKGEVHGNLASGSLAVDEFDALDSSVNPAFRAGK